MDSHNRPWGFPVEDKRTHILLFISSENAKTAKLRDAIGETLSTRSTRFGLYDCFGKYDIVADIFASPKLAMRFVGRIKKRIQSAHFSLVPCYDVENTLGFVEDFIAPLRFYSFIKWSDKPEVLGRIVDRLNEKVAEKPHLTLSLLLGANGYMIIARGNKWSELYERIQSFRREAGHGLSETSTIVAVNWETRDQLEKKPIDAHVFLKLKDENAKQIILDHLRPMPTTIHSSLGYFDLELNLQATSLSQLMDCVQKLRKNNADQILKTSTVLSYAISERLDDILPDVPGRLTYIEKEDAVSPLRRRKK